VQRSTHRCAAVVLAGILVIGCGGSDDGNGTDGGDPPPSQPPADASTTSTSTAPTPESEVEAAYLAYWEMTVRLQQAPDPEDAEIRQRATGAAADELVDGLTTLRALHHVVTFGPRYSHDVISAEVVGGEAVLRDCFVDDAETIEVSTRERVSGGLASGVFVATLEAMDGGWRVSELEVEHAQDGVGGCAGGS
jgi:hypothetical protein